MKKERNTEGKGAKWWLPAFSPFQRKFEYSTNLQLTIHVYTTHSDKFNKYR